MGVLMCLVALAVFVQRAAWTDIIMIAGKDEESSHMWLVPFAAAWLIWVRRDRLGQLRSEGSLLGAMVVLLGGLLGNFGVGHGYQAIWHLGAVVSLGGAILAVLGWRTCWSLAPAFGVLAFLVPVPPTIRQQIAIPMERATAIITQQTLETLGVAVQRSGNLLSVNGVDVTIAEACNGLRMILALVLVSYWFVFGNPLYGVARVIILAMSPLLAILCNVLRLLPVLWLYGHRPTSWAQGAHDVGGRLMMVVALVLLVAGLRVLRWARLPVKRLALVHD
jgi:exosortase